MKKIRVGILGATGMVGQRFIALLKNHPWFEICCIAASSKSAGKNYIEAVKNRETLDKSNFSYVDKLTILEVEKDIDQIVNEVDLVFSALEMDKEKIYELEIEYAKRDVRVISNNSAHRWTEDVPMIIPEINYEHVKLIKIQRKKHRWNKGLIVVKPNCSIQSYVIILTALKNFEPLKVFVTSLQAISGAGKTFTSWPEMIDNVIPFISGEEEKSEKEPLKIWGTIHNDQLKLAQQPIISATCIRIPVTDGHMASIAVKFKKKPSRTEFIDSLRNFKNPLLKLELPSLPKTSLIKFLPDDDRPQTKIDRNFENGMGVTIGRLKEDCIHDWKFITLSHNAVRGAAGGAILMAELLVRKGYIS